jgi:hypothetical protein
MRIRRNFVVEGLDNFLNSVLLPFSRLGHMEVDKPLHLQWIAWVDLTAGFNRP